MKDKAKRAVCSHLEFGRRIPNDNVGIVSRLQLSLPVVETGMLSSLDTNPIDDLPNADAPLLPLGPQQTEAKSKGADSAPRAHYVACIDLLELCHAWAVVANDAVDRAVEQSLPQRLPIGAVADGWATFELGSAGGNVLCRERKVVETGLDCERET